jgi:hypothetical protein
MRSYTGKEGVVLGGVFGDGTSLSAKATRNVVAADLKRRRLDAGTAFYFLAGWQGSNEQRSITLRPKREASKANDLDGSCGGATASFEAKVVDVRRLRNSVLYLLSRQYERYWMHWSLLLKYIVLTLIAQRVLIPSASNSLPLTLVPRYGVSRLSQLEVNCARQRRSGTNTAAEPARPFHLQ